MTAESDSGFRPHPVSWTPDKVGRLWDYYATTPGYDAHYFSRHSGKSILAFARALVDLDGRRVLDFGCGPGYLLERLLDEGIRAAGIEFSRRSVEEASRRLARYPNFGGVTLATGVPTPAPDGSADAVLCVEVVEHLFPAQVAPTLAEIRRLLAPGGVVIVTTPNEELLEAETVECPDCGCRFHRWQHMRRLDVSSLTALMSAAGFEAIACRATKFGGRRRPLSRRLRDRLKRLSGRPARPAATPHLIYVGRRA